MRQSCVLILLSLGCSPALIGPERPSAPVDGGRPGGGFVPSPDAGPGGGGSFGDAGDAGPNFIPDAGPLDSPDGGCAKPTAANTGVPTGTALSSRAGDLTITQDGAVVESVDVTGDVYINANNVTLRNSRIHGGIVMGTSNTNATIDHCEVGPDSGAYTSHQDLVGDHSFQLLYCNLHNFANGVRPANNVVMRGNYLHDPWGSTPEAASAYGAYGPGTLLLECNNLDMSVQAPGSPYGSANAVFEITCTDTSSPPSRFVFDHNWLGGGGYAFYLWGVWASSQVTNNVWDGKAVYGPSWYEATAADGGSITSWMNNTYVDGGVIDMPGSFGGINCKG